MEQSQSVRLLSSRLANILGINCVNYKLYNALVRKDGKEFWTYLCISKDYNKDRLDVMGFEEFYVKYRKFNENTLNFSIRMGIDKEIQSLFFI